MSFFRDAMAAPAPNRMLDEAAMSPLLPRSVDGVAVRVSSVINGQMTTSEHPVQPTLCNPWIFWTHPIF